MCILNIFLTQKCEWTEFPYENQVFNARGTCHIYFHTHLSTSKSFAFFKSQVMFVYILPFGKFLIIRQSVLISWLNYVTRKKNKLMSNNSTYLVYRKK